MTTVQKTRSLAEALDEVARWRAEELARHAAELGETDQEITSLKAAIVNLEQQLAARERSRQDLTERLPAVDAMEVERRYHAVFSALAVQAAAVGERSGRVDDAARERVSRLAATLASGDMAEAYEEYTQFKTQVEPTLKALPESYRKALAGHHEQVSAKVKLAVDEALSAPVTIDAEPLAIDVVYAVDAPGCWGRTPPGSPWTRRRGSRR